MQMYYGNTPIKGINVKHYEVSTSDANTNPEDVQSGLIYYAKGARRIGTGKSFEFANYGDLATNDSVWIPSNINIIELSSTEHPIKLNTGLIDLQEINFSTPQNIATVTINNIEYPLTVIVESNYLMVSCEQTFMLQAFYGKDNYV